MEAVLLSLSTALLMILMIKSAATLIGPDTIGWRRVPIAAIVLTAAAIAGVILQHSWRGAYGALDDDPSKSGWWRVITAVFMQDTGIAGVLWNIVTLAIIVALAEWFWGSLTAIIFFLLGAVAPSHIGSLLTTIHVLGAAHTQQSAADPRNFSGSSGATYFLAATVTGALLVQIGPLRDRNRLLALSVPVIGMLTWYTMTNAHGLVTTEGFVIGAVVFLLAHRLPNIQRDLRHQPHRTIGDIIPAARRTRRPISYAEPAAES